MRDRLANLGRLGVSVCLLALLLRRVSPRETAAALATANWPLLGLALALYVGSSPLRALRWRALVRAKGIKVPLARLVVLYYVGGFLNLMLPTGIGGDAIRAYELSRHAPAELAVGTVLVDRATGLLVLLLLAGLVLPLSFAALDPWVVCSVGALALASLCGMIVLVNGRPLRRLYLSMPLRLRALIKQQVVRRLCLALTGYNRRALAQALAVSLLFNMLLVAVNQLIGLGLGVHLPTRQYLIYVSLISFATALPFSLGGLGVRESAYTALFGQAGVAPSTALSMSLTFYLMNVVSGLIGGLLYAWEGVRKPSTGAGPKFGGDCAER
ncbi:MAG: lysylphosphatidylglycerol synthase transmembrane domain-containing protein [Anaerolineae bacterium]|nr:lysylphosphatidylglycerol synthase transmembrane domain-containing protein [Anaerolineae bacterium]